MCKTVVVLAAVSAITMTGLTQPSFADDSVTPGGDGQSTSRPPLTKAEIEKDNAKQTVADALWAAVEGTGTEEEYQDARNAFMAEYPEAGAIGPECSACIDFPTGSVDLKQSPQSESWWCGPATAGMIIKQLKRDDVISTTRSQYDSDHKISQTNLARPAYMDAENDGTYRTDMRRGLNRWIGRARFTVKDTPSAKKFKKALIFNILGDGAMAVAALEHARDHHYNDHPSHQTVDHWVPAYGYKKEGKKTKFADSSTSLWPGVEPYFKHKTKKFVKRYVKPSKAIVW